MKAALFWDIKEEMSKHTRKSFKSFLKNHVDRQEDEEVSGTKTGQIILPR